MPPREGLERLEYAAFIYGFQLGADWADPAGVMSTLDADQAARRAWDGLQESIPIPADIDA